MPVLRSAKSKRLYPPLIREPSSRSLQSTVRSTHSFASKLNISRSVPASPVASSTEISNVRNAFRCVPSEAKLYREVCEEHLKRLLKVRELLKLKLEKVLDIRRKDFRRQSEAAIIVKKLRNEYYKKGNPIRGRHSSRGTRKLDTTDVSRILEDTLKTSDNLKLKKRLLIAKKQKVELKIQLAVEAIKFCRSFLD